jgi:propanol-preferring alcohol dehydrogenase
MMQAWRKTPQNGQIALQEAAIPTPDVDEVLVAVHACGVCRTDLHVIDGELPMHKKDIVPGHQVVGRITATGSAVTSLRVGELVGVAWLRRTCGSCRWCRRGQENLCPNSQYTGWDADGGFAEYAVAPEAFCYPLRDDDDAIRIAPLLCAGIIGYRALSRAQLPPGGRLGIFGFGSSAHITAQLAMAGGAEVVVMTRGARNRELAQALGAAFVGEEMTQPPEPIDAGIIFAPSGDLVPFALACTTRGGTIVSAGIHMSDIPVLQYDRTLFQERTLTTVTANTRSDGEAFLRIARHLGISPTVTRYPFAEADTALDDLRSGRLSGSAVLEVMAGSR